MKKPSYENVLLTVFPILLLSLVLWNVLHPQPEPERYIDYCGDSVVKQPDAMQQDGITPLMLPDEDIPKYEHQASWIRPATSGELQILLRRYDQRTLPSGYQLWTVTAEAPSIAHTLARQYQCVIEGMLDTSG
jgi:hypothetical protein